MKNFIRKIAKCWNWTIFFKYFTKVHKIELVTLISGFFSWNWNSQNLWGHFWVIIQPNRFTHLSFCKFAHKAQFCTKFAEKRVRVWRNYKNDQNWWVVPKIGWYTMQHYFVEHKFPPIHCRGVTPPHDINRTLNWKDALTKWFVIPAEIQHCGVRHFREGPECCKKRATCTNDYQWFAHFEWSIIV